jgi:hypothetical protein
MLAILLAISFMAIPIPAVEIRSSVATDWFNNGSFVWTADDFAGFYYDTGQTTAAHPDASCGVF